MPMLLPVRPRPELGESQYGYLLRITEANGWTRVTDIIQLCGVPGYNQPLGAAVFDRMVQALCIALRLPLAEWHNAFPENPCCYDEQRKIHRLYLSHPRFCPDCVSDTGLFKAEWCLGIITHCEQHQRPLLETCPSCSKPLIWQAQLATHCPHCRQPWSSQPQQQVSVPPYQQVLKRYMSSRNNDAAIRFLRALTACLVRVWRPWDNLLPSLKKLVMLDTLSADLTQAYLLLCDPAYQAAWLRQLQVQRGACLSQLGEAAILLPDKILQQALPEPWVTEEPSPALIKERALPVFKERENQLIPLARRHLIRQSSDLHYQLSSTQLGQLLCISHSELNTLVEQKVLTPLNHTKVIRDRLFDLRQVDGLLARLPLASIQSADSWVMLGALSKSLELHGISLGQALVYVFTGDLPAVRPTISAALGQLMVNPLALERLMKRHLDEQLSRKQSTSWVAAVLDVPVLAVSDMVNKGLLLWANWRICGTTLDGDYLAHFWSRHLSLSRWGSLNGRNPSRVAAQLDAQGLTPVFVSDGVWIYSRTQALSVALAQLTQAPEQELDWDDGVIADNRSGTAC